jgi:hypothetical protein
MTRVYRSVPAEPSPVRLPSRDRGVHARLGHNARPIGLLTCAGVSRRWSPIMEVVEFHRGVQNQTAVPLRRRDRSGL